MKETGSFDGWGTFCYSAVEMLESDSWVCFEPASTVNAGPTVQSVSEQFLPMLALEQMTELTSTEPDSTMMWSMSTQPWILT